MIEIVLESTLYLYKLSCLFPSCSHLSPELLRQVDFPLIPFLNPTFILFYRCINAVIAGNEYVRIEKENQQAESLTVHVDENLQTQLQSSLTAEASAKSTLQLFVKLSAGIILDCWNENSRYISNISCEVLSLSNLSPALLSSMQAF